MSEQNKNFQQYFGTEMEYSISVRHVGEKDFKQMSAWDERPGPHLLVQKYMPDYVVGQGQGVHASSDVMLSNGGRYYVDSGSHPEFATAENTTYQGTVLSELGGERLVADCVYNMVKGEERIEAAILQKRVVDALGQTWGWHLNISESRKAFPDRDVLIEKTRLQLPIHYATSRRMLGAGAVIRYFDSDSKVWKYRYSLGQKVQTLERDNETTTTSAKPILNLKDESFNDDATLRRVHIVGEDAHVSPWAMEMALGTYSLVLAGCRQEKIRAFRPAGVVSDFGAKLAKIATYDIAGTQKFEFYVDGDEDTRKYTTNEVQKLILEDIKNIEDKTPEMEYIISQWERFTGAMDRDPLNFIESDALAKLRRINEKLKRENPTDIGMDVNASLIDLNYTTILYVDEKKFPNKSSEELRAASPAGQLRSKWFPARMPSADAVKHASENPPTTTRAYSRGNAIKSGKVDSAKWEMFRYKTDPATTAVLKVSEGTIDDPRF